MLPGAKNAAFAAAFVLHLHDDCQVAVTNTANPIKTYFFALQCFRILPRFLCFL
jgi:hypothetical protein